MAVVFTRTTPVDGATDVALGSGYHLLTGTLTFSGTYPTGGEVLDIGKKIPTIGAARGVRVLTSLRGNEAEYDLPNKKLKLYSSANTEVAAGAYNAALTASVVPVAFLVRG